MSIRAIPSSNSNPSITTGVNSQTPLTQIQILRPQLGITQPDAVTIASQATQEFYKRAMVRYRRQRGAKVTRYGRIALETLSSLLPSVATVLERPYLEDEAIGVITGRSILSLIKEGAEKRPNCVLTSHYMAEMLGVYENIVSIASVSTQTPEPEAEDISTLSTDDRRQHAIEALERALTDLEKIGLIQREALNNTELLHPYSEKKTGQENLFDWLMSLRSKHANLSNQDLNTLRETHAEALKAFQDNRYLLDIIYFSDRDFHGINGWDLLSLIIEAEDKMLGAVPVESICRFFEARHEKAVINGLEDLAQKIGIITLHRGDDNALSTIESQPYAAIGLNMRFHPPR
jgi:hypothetical protein